jgi:hypothetical protein
MGMKLLKVEERLKCDLRDLTPGVLFPLRYHQLRRQVGTRDTLVDFLLVRG